MGCHFLLQGIFLTQGLNPHTSLASPALAGRFFTTVPAEELQILHHCTNWRGLWQPCVRQIYQHHYSRSTCAFCVPESPFGNSHNISNFFIIIIFVIVIIDFWCYYCNCFGVPWTHTHIKCEQNIVCVLTVPLTCWFPSLCLSLGLRILSDNYIEIRPLSNLMMTSKCSSKRTSLMTLTLNQKLEMIKHSEGESMLNAEIGQKLDLMFQGLWMQRKSSCRKLEVLL